MGVGTGIGGGAPWRHRLAGRRKPNSCCLGDGKITAMGYAKDFQDPRVLGDLLLPWPGEGDQMEFRDMAAGQV